MYLFHYGKKTAVKVVTGQKRVGDKEHRKAGQNIPVYLAGLSQLSLQPLLPRSPPPLPLHPSRQLQLITTPSLPSSSRHLACRVQSDSDRGPCMVADGAQRSDYTKLQPHKTSWYVSPPSFCRGQLVTPPYRYFPVTPPYLLPRLVTPPYCYFPGSSLPRMSIIHCLI